MTKTEGLVLIDKGISLSTRAQQELQTSKSVIPVFVYIRLIRSIRVLKFSIVKIPVQNQAQKLSKNFFHPPWNLLNSWNS